VIDDIIPELQEAKLFTKVDVKNAFWHVTLDDASSALTTFETPYERYRWNRLPMGISVSSEIFQRKLNEALSGLQGIATIADDILIYGRGKTTDEARRDHDDNLISLKDAGKRKSAEMSRNSTCIVNQWHTWDIVSRATVYSLILRKQRL